MDSKSRNTAPRRLQARALFSALTLTVGLSTGSIRTACADDFAQWRGPQRNGISNEKGLLKEWPTSGPKLRWQVKDVGYGFGAPAVSGGRVYLISNQGLENESVHALSVADGKPIWSKRIGKVGNPKQFPSYPAARSTPTVDGAHLYALGSDGDLVCLAAATGELKWKKSLRNDFGGQPGIWAYSESPLIDGDTLVCTPGGTTATLVALNKTNGAVIWKSAVPGGDEACYASVITLDAGGTKQYVQFMKKGVIGVDAKTGKFLWRFDKTAETRMGGNIPTPVAYDGCVYSASGLTGGGLARIKGGNGAFVAEPVYFEKKLPSSIGGVVRVGDNLFGTGGTGLNCVGFKTGTVKWSDRSIGPGSILVADGRLYIHGENGDVALVEAASDGYHEKGKFTPPNHPEHGQERTWAYPVLANGRLYIRDLGTLWCFNVKAGGR